MGPTHWPPISTTLPSPRSALSVRPPTRSRASSTRTRRHRRVERPRGRQAREAGAHDDHIDFASGELTAATVFDSNGHRMRPRACRPLDAIYRWTTLFSYGLLMLFALVAGAGTALSPCVLPVLPAVLAAGVTGGRRRPLGVVIGPRGLVHVRHGRARLRDRRPRAARRSAAHARDRDARRLRAAAAVPAARRAGRGMRSRASRPGRPAAAGDGFGSGVCSWAPASASSTRPAPARSSPA